jgi:hypothetical protein
VETEVEAEGVDAVSGVVMRVMGCRLVAAAGVDADNDGRNDDGVGDDDGGGDDIDNDGCCNLNV